MPVADGLARLRAGTPITMRPDAWSTPLPTPELAARLVALAAAGTGGVRHLPGPRCSRWEFAGAAARCFGLDPALVPADQAGGTGLRTTTNRWGPRSSIVTISSSKSIP